MEIKIEYEVKVNGQGKTKYQQDNCLNIVSKSC